MSTTTAAMNSDTNTPAPTIDDLRVKMCYICREEEVHGQPENPPMTWTHPCSCTLIAHEKCLLQWIQTSQADAGRAANAMKCPQCGSNYEITSDNPMALRFLELGNKWLSILGKVITVGAVTAVVTCFASGVYVLCTTYGAYAVRTLIGQEMYDALLTDDPSNWPMWAYIELPLIPISLILSRTSGNAAVTTLLSVLVPLPALQRQPRIVLNDWIIPPTNAASVKQGQLLGSHWPPSPFLFGLVILPIIKRYYRRYFNKFSDWLLETRPVNPERIRRYIWALNGRGAFDVQIGAEVREVGRPEAAPAPAGAGAGAGAAPAGENEAGGGALAAAERTINVNTGSVGRLLGGALLIPAISSVMGSLLERLSHHSWLLRKLLGIRPYYAGFSPSMAVASYAGLGEAQNWGQMSILKKMMTGMSLGVRYGASFFVGGLGIWSNSDPVWWRNVIGLGIFVVAKDCMQLLHLHLAKRELESRTVKNRSFKGVDVKELDLIPTTRTT